MSTTLVRADLDPTIEPGGPAQRAMRATAGRARALRPALSLVSSLYLTVQLCLIAWVAVPAVALGWTPRVITSDSMRPAMTAGDVILTGPPPTDRVGNGTIVLYEHPTTGDATTHRVIDLEDNGTYRTKGDANPTPDPVPVEADDIVGVARLMVPLVGTPIHWFRSGNVVALGAWAVLTVAAVSTARPRRKVRP